MDFTKISIQDSRALSECLMLKIIKLREHFNRIFSKEKFHLKIRQGIRFRGRAHNFMEHPVNKDGRERGEGRERERGCR